MADKAISELVSAEQITATDMFVLEQNGTAKKLTGQILLNWLTKAADGHGGISGIAKVKTSGLVDTYRITMADTTTFDFVVTNGAKGDQGDNAYVWIKFASQEPTAASHSMGEIPDDWIGIYAGNLDTPPEDWTLYKWFQIKGEKGNTGDPATLVSSAVEYLVSDSGSVIPSGSWTTTIPAVAQGKYLWTRTTQTFNTGEPVVSYSISRMGRDGLGTVATVNQVSADDAGNVQLCPSDIGAVATDGTTPMAADLPMGGHKMTGLGEPEADTDAARKAYVDAEVKKAHLKNLLDNSYFRQPVNQRGATNYSEGATQYTIDRWRIPSKLSVTVNEGRGITIACSTTASTLNGLRQFLPDEKKFVAGDVVTLACMEADGTLHVGSVTVPSEGSVYAFGDYADEFTGEVNAEEGYINLLLPIGKEITLLWAALYEGEYTAETLPEYQPKGYFAELQECLRYYWKPSGNLYGHGYVYSATTAYCIVNSPVEMRIAPTITVSSDIEFTIRDGDGNSYTGVKLGNNIYKVSTTIRFGLELSSSGLTRNSVISVGKTSGTIEFSADL